MVSSISDLIRPRRGRHSRNKKKTDAIIPEIKIFEADKEVSVNDSTSEDMSPTGTTVVEEITVTSEADVKIIGKEAELNENGTEGKEETHTVTVIETDEVVHPHNLCSLNDSLEKVKEVVEHIPEEVKEAAKYSGLATISITVLFMSIVLYRVLKHFFEDEEEGFFCKYFAHPFHPMFDAMCDEHADFYSEFWTQCSILGDEITGAFNGIIKMFQDGCHAFAIIFWFMFGGIYETVRYGFHELFENVSENVSFLVNFCIYIINQLYTVIIEFVMSSYQHLSNSLESVKRTLLSNENHPKSWW